MLKLNTLKSTCSVYKNIQIYKNYLFFLVNTDVRNKNFNFKKYFFNSLIYVIFFKNILRKPVFLKNFIELHNIITLASIVWNDCNYLQLQSIALTKLLYKIKLKLTDFNSQWQLYVNHLFENQIDQVGSAVDSLDSENFLEEFNSIFSKKFKFFFFKTSGVDSTNIKIFNKNLLINYLSYRYFLNLVPTPTSVEMISENTFYISCKKTVSINIWSSLEPFDHHVVFVIKKHNGFIFFKFKFSVKGFRLNKITIQWYVAFKGSVKRSTRAKAFKKYKVSRKKFKRKRFFNFIKKKLKRLFIMLTKYNNKPLSLINNDVGVLNQQLLFSSYYLRNFIFKNVLIPGIGFFSFSENLSNSLLNSYFYNCYFNLDSNKFVDHLSVMKTNITPVSTLSYNLQKNVLSKINLNNIPSFYKYVYYTLSSSLESILKKKIFLKIMSITNNNQMSLDYMDTLFLKNRSLQSRIGRGFFLHEMLDMLYVTFMYKDLNFLMRWFVKTMYRVGFLKHKKLISTFKQILSLNSDFFLKHNNVRGFFFDIRGKVGVTGNAMKRHLYFCVGDFSKTTKKYKFDYQFDIIKTHTGALGITMYLTY